MFGRNKNARGDEFDAILPGGGERGSIDYEPRQSAIGWLQQRMSQIGRSPSTAGGSSYTPHRSGASNASLEGVTPVAMAPLDR